ncbi:EAL domain-containing protein [Dechloromonas sp. ZY10]|uniref:EAL domain-containing protein n=1 Tax=Dechloromonas aquae TaxID=2664436 RepID=UPI0035287B22
MFSTQWKLAKELADAAQVLRGEGWQRAAGEYLHQILGQAGQLLQKQRWYEAAGRAEALLRLFDDFLREAPAAVRLRSALLALDGLVALIREGRLDQGSDATLLPAIPSDWSFYCCGAPDSALPDLEQRTTLESLGFRVLDTEALPAATRGGIVLAPAAWLLAQISAGAAPLPLTVALADPAVPGQAAALTELGIVWQLPLPFSVAALLRLLCGQAWQPAQAYRIACYPSVPPMPSAAGLALQRLPEDLAEWPAWVSAQASEAVLLSGTAAELVEWVAALRGGDPLPPVFCLEREAVSGLVLQARLLPAICLAAPRDAETLSGLLLQAARQRREQLVQEARQRLALAQLETLKQALDTHAIVSASAPDGSITYVNRKFCEVSGYSLRELIGRNHRVVKSGHHPAAFFDGMWATIASGQTWQGEVQNRRKDGSPYWVQTTIAPVLDAAGVPQQYISIRTDVSEQKRLQASIEARGRLFDVLRRAMQSFVSSHDIVQASSQILDNVLSLTGSAFGFIGEVLQDDSGTPYLRTHAISDIAWDEASSAFYAAHREGGMEFRRHDSLFGAVLTTGEAVIANDPAGDHRRCGLPPGHPPLHAFLGLPIRYGDQLVGMLGLANRPGGYDQELIGYLAPLLATYGHLIEAYRLRHLQQRVIDDLARTRDAAEEASRARSALLVEHAQELRQILKAIFGHAQLLRFNDGIDAEGRDQVAEILRAGEQFTALLDELTRRADSGMRSQSVEEMPRRNGKPRILVAEDNPANQAVLRMQLDVLGCEAEIVADGVAALKRWKTAPFDLLLIDRNMPQMDGMALTRAIRAAEQERGGHAPIVGITAVNSPEDLAACCEAGMDGVLPKPIELDDLRQCVQQYLSPAAFAESVPPVTAPPRVAADAPFDRALLAQIVGAASPQQIRELLDIFTAAAQQDLELARRQLQQHDFRALAQVLHRLKSAARMVAANRCGELAETAEKAALAGAGETLGSLLDELDYALAAVEAQVAMAVPASPSLPLAAVAPASLPAGALIVDDDPLARRQFGVIFDLLGVSRVFAAEGGLAALAEVERESNRIELLVMDLRMPGMDGIEFLRRLADAGYRGDIVIASGVEERLLQIAAEVARSKGLHLLGAVRKPLTRQHLLDLLATRRERGAHAPAQAGIAFSLGVEELRQGMRNDEFSVHFQPKVDAATLVAVGVEALARWQHNGRFVPPDLFIRLAEEHGLISELSKTLADKALAGIGQLAAAGFRLKVAINLSANWLNDISLPEFMLGSIQAHGVAADTVILEITETGVMADVATALDVTSRLRLRGFQLSIDDFGTGYSSLEQLQRFPFGELKLDRSFVRGALKNQASRAILSSSVEMAKKMHMLTVAEGVETAEELDLVRGLGCDLVQGWHVAKAMPVEQLLVWLRARQG